MRWLLACLAFTLTVAGCFALATGAVGQGDAKKGEPDKGVAPAKGKEKDNDKDGVKGKTDKPSLPPGTIIMTAEDWQKALPGWPRMILMPLAEFQALKDRLAALERQVKRDREKAHACEMTGRLDGEYVTIRGEFTFSTPEPLMAVTLGLQGAYLTEKADLDGQSVLMDYTPEEGYSARVDKAGDQHRLVLHFRVPVTLRRPAGGAAVERSFELGLPGTLITKLALDLPAAVKEVRWNDTPEKPLTPGKWLITLGQLKALSLSWRESVPQPGAGPHLTAEGKIKVHLRDAVAELSAELVLEDARGQTKECQLVMPPTAEVKLDAPVGVKYELSPPGPKNPNYVLRFLEPNSERWVVSVFVKAPRPGAGGRLAVGPFYVQGAEHQRGTITVLAPESPLKQRLIYHRFGDVFQRDPPKATDVEAVFQYWALPNPLMAKAGKGGRVPLEVETRLERGPLEATVDQVVKIRPTTELTEIDLTAHVQIKSPSGGGDFIDMQMPRPRPRGVAEIAAAPGTMFPGVLPWAALSPVRGSTAIWATPLEFQVSEDGAGKLEMSPPDGLGRSRVTLPRTLGKSFRITIAGKYAIPADSQRVRLGLPKLLDVNEQRGKVTVQGGGGIELLVGERGYEEPVPERDRYQFAVDEPPLVLELAWRPYRVEFPVEALVDVTVRGGSAQVRQVLFLGALGATSPARAGQVQLTVPAGIKGLHLVRDKQPQPLVPEKGSVWVPVDNAEPREVVLEYDVPLGTLAQGKPRRVEIPAVWPQRATRRGAKVRVWCDGGTRVRLAEAGETWQDRGVEPVTGHDTLPALVLRGDSVQVPPTLEIDTMPGGGLPPTLCDRALIQAALGDDDALTCRARYFVTRFGAETLDMELPVRVADCQLKVSVEEVNAPGRTCQVAWEPVEGFERAARIKVQGATSNLPVVLDIRYKLPASTQETRLVGVTTLYPPTFRDALEVARMRWQLSLPSAGVAMPISRGARLDYRWGLQYGWLPSPEPAASASDLESWLTGKSNGGELSTVAVSFSRTSSEPQRVFHQPRVGWMLLCSVPLVVLFLVCYFAGLSRAGLAVVLGLLAVAGVALALTLPAVLPALFYGSQPALLVMALMLAVIWLMQERYRRQLVFIPGFTRLQPGSSLTRGSSSSKSEKLPREVSTVDSPARDVPALAGSPGSTSAKK